MRSVKRWAAPVALAVLGFLVASPAAALTIAGRAEVISAYSLRLEGYRIYLVGIDSIEEGQTCGINGIAWDCWPAAVRALQTIVETADISCEVVSGPNVLRQATARCTLGGEDIGALYVQAGFGLTIPAETTDYEDDLAAAKAAGVGLWQGSFYEPAVWRQANGIFASRPAFRPVPPG